MTTLNRNPSHISKWANYTKAWWGRSILFRQFAWRQSGRVYVPFSFTLFWAVESVSLPPVSFLSEWLILASKLFRTLLSWSNRVSRFRFTGLAERLVVNWLAERWSICASFRFNGLTKPVAASVCRLIFSRFIASCDIPQLSAIPKGFCWAWRLYPADVSKGLSTDVESWGVVFGRASCPGGSKRSKLPVVGVGRIDGLRKEGIIWKFGGAVDCISFTLNVI